MLKQISDILAERKRQDAKWGEQNHDPITWLAILMEEVGETAKEALTMRCQPNDPHGDEKYEAARLRYRDEALQVAAVAFAMLECFDRGNWEWPEFS